MDSCIARVAVGVRFAVHFLRQWKVNTWKFGACETMKQFLRFLCFLKEFCSLNLRGTSSCQWWLVDLLWSGRRGCLRLDLDHDKEVATAFRADRHINWETTLNYQMGGDIQSASNLNVQKCATAVPMSPSELDNCCVSR